MAFIPVPNTVLVELVYNQLGQVTENTLYFQGAAPWTVDDMVDLAEQIKAWWITELEAVVPNTIALTAVKVTDLSSQTAPGIIDVNGLPNYGGSVEPALPNHVTATVNFTTALRGRSFRGRNYIIQLNEGQVVGNTINPGPVEFWVASYMALPEYVISNGAEHVVVSRYANKQPRVTGVATPVTGYTMPNIVKSQRRRLPGYGQ